MSTMKAIRIHSYGGPEVLSMEQIPRPEPKPGEILVNVRAAGVNPVDWKTRKGEGAAGMIKRPPPFILGWDFAGTVAALGEGVTRFAAGDAVYGMVNIPDEGTYAEYVTLPAEHAARKPETLTFDDAAAVPLAALTAWQALVDVGHLGSGQKVLIHAGAGGVGHIAVQLAKARGATVVATASKENHDYLRSLGADLIIDYSHEHFEDRVKDADLVLDTVGGATQQRSFAALRPGGTLVSILSHPDKVRARESGVHAHWTFVQPNGDRLDQIAKLVDEGKLRPTVSHVYPLLAAREAHTRLERGHTRGKLVLRV